METFTEVMGHPIHAMLVAFPIGLLVTVFFVDIIYLWRREEFWARCAYVILVMGLVWTLIAAVPGLLDYWLTPMARIVNWHLAVGLALAVFTLIHVRMRRPPTPSDVPRVLPVMSLIMVLFVAAQGYLGGELVFHYRVGVMPAAGESAHEGNAMVASDPPVESPSGDLAAGRAVFEKKCLSCHSVIGLPGGGDAGPNLTHEGAVHNLHWIQVQIKNPTGHNPSAQMPAISLPDRDLQELSVYLASLR